MGEDTPLLENRRQTFARVPSTLLSERIQAREQSHAGLRSPSPQAGYSSIPNLFLRSAS